MCEGGGLEGEGEGDLLTRDVNFYSNAASYKFSCEVFILSQTKFGHKIGIKIPRRAKWTENISKNAPIVIKTVCWKLHSHKMTVMMKYLKFLELPLSSEMLQLHSLMLSQMLLQIFLDVIRLKVLITLYCLK